MMIRKINETLLELLMGILLFTIACQLIGMWFVTSVAAYSIGLWLGALLAILSAIHMYWSLNRNLTLNADNEKGAQAYGIRANMIRYLVIVAVFLVLCLTDFAYPLAAFLGIMGLKIGAYVQPLMKKIYDKFIDKEVNV
ncbi:MAG: ATP synthase subunit I [Lachnospiraceae bacterium]|nr:ATP synthase subunit I [Candidatus Colinaster scatohippi]